MTDDAFYRTALAQLQIKHSQTVTALKQQVAALSQHNEVLSAELRTSKQQQTHWTVADLKHAVEIQAMAKAEAIVADRYWALTRDVWTLKRQLQSKENYWAKSSQATMEDWARRTKELVEAKAETTQRDEEIRTLRRKMKTLKKRADTAVATSYSFEQRMLDVETQLARNMQKLQDKTVDVEYLMEELVTLQMQQDEMQSAESSGLSSPTSVSSWSARETTETPVTLLEAVHEPAEVPEQTPQRRLRKRELTLLEETSDSDHINDPYRNVTLRRKYKRRRIDSNAIAFDNLRLVR
uniref:Uncharacterized protein n=1 Tax=Phytophthora ramorum TaxID=164328 RepID=H3H523_PHYRM